MQITESTVIYKSRTGFHSVGPLELILELAYVLTT